MGHGKCRCMRPHPSLSSLPLPSTPLLSFLPSLLPSFSLFLFLLPPLFFPLPPPLKLSGPSWYARPSSSLFPCLSPVPHLSPVCPCLISFSLANNLTKLGLSRNSNPMKIQNETNSYKALCCTHQMAKANGSSTGPAISRGQNNGPPGNG